MSEPYEAQNDQNDDYLILLRGLLDVSEAIKGTPTKQGDWELDAEGLLLKTVYHASAVYYLSRATKIPLLQASFLDLASIQVLVRATLESVLVFYHVFAAPTTDPERELRYEMWNLSGLLTRQRYAPLSSWGKQRKQAEASQVEMLRNKIRSSDLYQKLTAKQQRKILNKGEWRVSEKDDKGKYDFSSWAQIATSAGLSKKQAYEMYSYLSSYAHSSYLSVMQVRQAVTRKQREKLIDGSTGIVKIAMALIANLYTKVFPKSKSVMGSNVRFANAVDTWLYVGSDALEREEIDWDAEFGDTLSELDEE